MQVVPTHASLPVSERVSLSVVCCKANGTPLIKELTRTMSVVAAAFGASSVASVRLNNTYSQRTTALKVELWSRGYDPEVFPPGPEPKKGVVVGIGLNVFQVEKMDVKNGILTLHAWVRLEWTDLRLAWSDHPDFGDIEYVSRVSGRVMPLIHRCHLWYTSLQVLHSCWRETNAVGSTQCVGSGHRDLQGCNFPL